MLNFAALLQQTLKTYKSISLAFRRTATLFVMLDYQEYHLLQMMICIYLFIFKHRYSFLPSTSSDFCLNGWRWISSTFFFSLVVKNTAPPTAGRKKKQIWSKGWVFYSDYRVTPMIRIVVFTLDETPLDLQLIGESNGAVTSITVISSEWEYTYEILQQV